MDKKQGSQSRIVVLKLKPSLLQPFSATPATTTPNGSGSSNASPRNSSPLAVGTSPQAGSPTNSEVTPAPVNGSKPGPKRGRQSGIGAAPGKPGRKKQKLDNGTSPGPIVNGPTSVPHAKLGPKANQGAINAQLRALDRTGKPCKRWTKAGFSLKSFTGVQWTVPTWATRAVEKSMDLPPSTQLPSEGTQVSLGTDQVNTNSELPVDMMENSS